VNDIFVMDFGNLDIGADMFQYGIPRHAKKTRYYGTHLDTIRRCVKNAKTEYVWIVSTICDYMQFDFHYKPAPWEATQIHCWASNRQQKGDTFLVHVKEFLKQDAAPLEKLEWFKDVHYHYPGVNRLPIGQTMTSNLIDTASTVTDYYTLLCEKTPSFHPIMNAKDVVPPLWEKRAIYPLNKSGSAVLVPNDCKGKISTQLYDYPYISYDFIDKVEDKPLDIVFISNGEINANRNYTRLQRVLTNNGVRNEVHLLQGIKGRTEAYQRAAQMSKTPWFFAVFAKCQVNDDFDFNWQPDYMQERKHYVFHAKNPVNGLEYGHMGVIAYNKDLVLNPPNEIGLDFTMSAPHAVVPELSCVGQYNIDKKITWRTAFRETLKLRGQADTNPTVENEWRLHCWITKGEGAFGDWSITGAQDAVEYYNEVKGNPAKLKLSYEWGWLDSRLLKSHPLKTG